MILKPDFELLLNLATKGPDKKYKWVKEYKFCNDRRWKNDYAIIDLKIAIEIEGGTFSGGRHTRGEGYKNDCIKYNTAQCMGWIVLRFTTDMIKESPDIVLTHIEEALRLRS
jgi:very-short-patch-repair endonuclease